MFNLFFIPFMCLTFCPPHLLFACQRFTKIRHMIIRTATQTKQHLMPREIRMKLLSPKIISKKTDALCNIYFKKTRNNYLLMFY